MSSPWEQWAALGDTEDEVLCVLCSLHESSALLKACLSIATRPDERCPPTFVGLGWVACFQMISPVRKLQVSLRKRWP